jgi:hypothetical protein
MGAGGFAYDKQDQVLYASDILGGLRRVVMEQREGRRLGVRRRGVC